MGVGLANTLMHAIGHYVKEHNPTANVSIYHLKNSQMSSSTPFVIIKQSISVTNTEMLMYY